MRSTKLTKLAKDVSGSPRLGGSPHKLASQLGMMRSGNRSGSSAPSLCWTPPPKKKGMEKLPWGWFGYHLWTQQIAPQNSSLKIIFCLEAFCSECHVQSCTGHFEVCWDTESRSLGSNETMYNIYIYIISNIYIYIYMYTQIVDKPLDLVNRVVKGQSLF